MSLPSITVYSLRNSPRLRYVLDWLLVGRLGLQYTITDDQKAAATAPYCISHGFLANAVSIHAVPDILWETGIQKHEIVRSKWQGLHALYFDNDSLCTARFDMLSGIFYLLTRYEEYLEYKPDKHDRYPHEASILSIDGVLERPIVDEWVEWLRNKLQEDWSLTIPTKPFSFRPTYDIDIAWSYLHKGFKRSIGATLKDFSRLRFGQLGERFKVMKGIGKDPYDAYNWMAGVHMTYDLSPAYFILAALRPTAYDKNISPRHPRMSSLIRGLAVGGEVGIHPSYYSKSKPQLLNGEKQILEAIIGKPITISRQHYIRLDIRKTYHTLCTLGIRDDYSMGYSTHIGFRAGTGAPFPFYSIPQEHTIDIIIHPFAFMDTTARYDMGMDVKESFTRLEGMAEKLRAANSTLITILHNFSLGKDKGWEGWRKSYEAFLQKMRMAK